MIGKGWGAVHLLVLGLDQHTAPLAVRERLSWDISDLSALLPPLLDRGLGEVALLCTCNRTEFYAVAQDPTTARQVLGEVLVSRSGLGAEELEPLLYRFVGAEECARHLCRVAVGLESLVLGETQVLGQVKQAYLRSAEVGTVGVALHGLFHQVLAAAKRVHATTELAQAPVSVGAAAVDLARRHLGELAGRRAVLLGAGETAGTVARRLQEAGLAELVVANRTLEGARQLAASVGGRAATLGDLPELLEGAHVVIASTAAKEPLVGSAALAMRGPGAGPLLIVDIAVPRNVDPAVATLPGVLLCNIDDLEDVAAGGRRARARQAQAAETLIEEDVRRFVGWWRGRDAVPLIAALRQRFVDVAEAQAQELLRRLPGLTPAEQDLVRQASRRIAATLVHLPVQYVREQASTPQGVETVRVLADAFALELPGLRSLPGGRERSQAAGEWPRGGKRA